MKIAIAISSSLLGLALLLAALWVLWLIRPRRHRQIDPDLLRDYAHRGLHGAEIPENSLAAFEAACKEGYGIELDVQLSRDGQVMVFHDDTLERVTGTQGKLCDLDAKELQRLRLNGSDQTIPTFCEVLALVNGRVPLLVELKGETMDTSLCAKVAELLAAYPGKYCIESFNPLLVRGMKKLLPQAVCGLLYTNVCRDRKKYSLLNIALTLMALNVLARPHFIAFFKKDRTSLPVKITTGLYRAPKFVWTPKGEKEIQTAHENGECAIFERK